MSRELQAFKDAILVRNVLARVARGRGKFINLDDLERAMLGIRQGMESWDEREDDNTERAILKWVKDYQKLVSQMQKGLSKALKEGSKEWHHAADLLNRIDVIDDKVLKLTSGEVEKKLDRAEPVWKELDQLIGGQRVMFADDHEAMEFTTPEALKKYLEEHPKADKSNHSVKDGPANDNDPKDEDQPGYGDNPTQFADAKTHKQLAKRFSEVDHAGRTMDRLKSQYERMRSYRYNDPAKAKEVAEKLVLQRNNILNATGATLDDAERVIEKAKSAKMSPQEKHWVDFLGESVGRTRKAIDELMSVTKGKGLAEVTTSPLMIGSMIHQTNEVIERFRHTTSVLRNVVKT